MHAIYIRKREVTVDQCYTSRDATFTSVSLIRYICSRFSPGHQPFFPARFSIKTAFYVLFLSALSFALIYGSTRQDPTQYNGSADNFRAFCEIFSILCLIIHLFEEIDEIERFVSTGTYTCIFRLQSVFFSTKAKINTV